MLLVREIFTAKPGQASKFAKLMKETMLEKDKYNTIVMTDMVGEYNTVVMQYTVKDLTDFQKMMEEMSKKPDPEMEKKMAGYTDMYLTGRREIFRIWE